MFKRLKGRLGQASTYVAGIVQQVSQSDPLALGTVLAVSLPLVIWNALRYQLPMGYAGFYSLMAEQISEGGFRPPVVPIGEAVVRESISTTCASTPVWPSENLSTHHSSGP